MEQDAVRVARRDAFCSAAWCALVGFLFAWRPVTDSDAWYHLATGRWIAQHGRVPSADTWTFTAEAARWIPHGWLFALASYAAFAAAGYGGLMLLKTLLVSGTLYLHDRTAHLAGAPAAVRLPLVAISAWFAAPRLMDRPQLVTFLLGAATLLLLERWRRDPARDRRPPWKLLWPLVPLFWAWGNCHAGVIYGYGLLGAYAAELLAGRAFAAARRLAVLAACCVAVSLAGPNHVWTLLYPLIVLPKLKRAGFEVIEFQAEPAGTPPWHRWAVGAVVLGWLLLGRRRPLSERITVAGIGALAFVWMRERAFFALMMIPPAAGLAGRIWDAARAPRPARGALAAALAIPALAVLVPAAVQPRPLPSRSEEAMPSALASFFLGEKLPSRVLNMPVWGGYLAWRGGGSIRLFVDPRMELFPEQVLRDLLAIQYARPERPALLAKYGVESALLDYGEFYPGSPGRGKSVGFYKAFFEDPGWSLVYWDDHGMIYVRRDLAEARRAEIRPWRVVNPDSRDLEYLGTGDRLTSAIAELRDHAQAFPSVRRSRQLLGAACLKAGMAREAAVAFQWLTDQPGPRAADFEGLAFSLDETGALKEAAAAADEGLRRFGDNAPLLDLAGVFRARSGRPDEGLEMLRRAERLGPPSFERASNMARMARELKDEPAARGYDALASQRRQATGTK